MYIWLSLRIWCSWLRERRTPCRNIDASNTGNPVLQNSLVHPREIAPSLNGVRGNGVYFSLDGVNNIDTYQVTGGPFPNPDAILEFSAVTSTFGARFNPVTKGLLSSIPRSPAPDGKVQYSRSVRQDEHQFVVKTDYLRGHHAFFARYFFDGFKWDPVGIENGNLLASYRGSADSAIRVEILLVRTTNANTSHKRYQARVRSRND